MAPSDPGAAPPPPPAWQAPPTEQVAYGGFWIRVVAYLIDAIVLNIVLWLLSVVTGLRLISYTATDHLEPLPILAPLVVNWLYFALMESSRRGATLGKMAVGLRVVTGGPAAQLRQCHRPLLRQVHLRPDPRHRLHHGRLHRAKTRPARHDREHPGSQSTLKRPP